MGRGREYDEDVVLANAMHAFRQRGYHAVSIRDLEAATGLKVGSIYNSFGDKAGLFEAAFAYYERAVLAARIGRFAPPSAGIAGLRALFLSLLEEPNGEAFGCLITNMAVELGGGASHRGVARSLETLTRTFIERLRAAGWSEATAQIDSTRLLALYQGVLVLVRAGHAKPVVGDMIDDAFDQLERSHAA